MPYGKLETLTCQSRIWSSMPSYNRTVTWMSPTTREDNGIRVPVGQMASAATLVPHCAHSPPFSWIHGTICNHIHPRLSRLVLQVGVMIHSTCIHLPQGRLDNLRFIVWLAILSIFCIDFVSTLPTVSQFPFKLEHIAVLRPRLVQALDCALLVDTLPTAKQPAGNAWAASRLATGCGKQRWVSC
jgi:hypothetical protein